MGLDYGIFNDIVKVAGLIISVGLALTLSWKGRSNWEPSEQDVNKGPQRITGLVTAVLLVVIWLIPNDGDGNSLLKTLSISLVTSTIISLLVYGFLITVLTYHLENGQKIIGGFKLVMKARKFRRKGITIQEILKTEAYDVDKVWTRESRGLSKAIFSIVYVILITCGTLALASVSILVINKTRNNAPLQNVRVKRPIQIALVLSGNIYFTREISEGFTSTLDSLLAQSSFLPNYETTIINPDTSHSGEYKENIESLFSKFPNGKPDYAVVIGTQASEFVHQNYHNKLPIIFIGVTDPIQSKLVKHLGPDNARGNIAGVIYSLSPGDYLNFFREAFPGKKFGYVYNRNYPQDEYFLSQLKSSNFFSPPMQIIPIEVSVPSLTEEQKAKADIFFGRYYVAYNIGLFINNSNKPFVAGGMSNITKGAVACIQPNSKKLGQKGAADYLYVNLIQGKALSDMPITGENRPTTAVNLLVARKYGITISQKTVKNADKVIE
jgi:ABC-type uncharacterized transport system substrate-binding protein